MAEDGVVTLQTEPISTAIAAITPPAGTDTPVTTPPEVNGVQNIPADTAGLFGGTLDSSSCDKAKLVSFLQESPSKAAAWAQTLGITESGIPEFVEPLTPVILRSDTAATPQRRITASNTTESRPSPRSCRRARPCW